MDELSRLRGSEEYGVCEDAARQGVRTTDGVTETRRTERIAFLRVSAISRPRPFLSILFPQEGKEWAAGG